MADFKGYLLKCGNQTDNSWMLAESYTSNPNQREELKAIRDENTRSLTRVTSDGMKTQIEFSVLPGDLAQKKKIQAFFNAGIGSNAERIKQRRCTITYWNDEENVYKTTDFYLPNFNYPIESFTNDNIYYQSFTIKLVEY